MIRSLIRRIFKQDTYYIPVTTDVRLQKAFANKVYISPLSHDLKMAFEKGKFDFDRSIRRLKRKERKNVKIEGQA